jgi:hypothetical protein
MLMHASLIKILNDLTFKCNKIKILTNLLG